MTDLKEWPAWMPNPLQEGFSMHPVENRTISQMEKGTAIRVEYDSDELEASCTVELNQIQAKWFARFWKETLFHGTHWFNFPLWVDGALQREAVRFKTLPKNSSVKVLMTRYDFTLQVEKRAMLSDVLFWLLDYVSPDQIVRIVDKLHRILHSRIMEAMLLVVELPHHFIIQERFARSTGLVPELPPAVGKLAGSTKQTPDYDRADSAIWRLAGSTRVPARLPWAATA